MLPRKIAPNLNTDSNPNWGQFSLGAIVRTPRYGNKSVLYLFKKNPYLSNKTMFWQNKLKKLFFLFSTMEMQSSYCSYFQTEFEFFNSNERLNVKDFKYYLLICWHSISWKLHWEYPLICGVFRWCHNYSRMIFPVNTFKLSSFLLERSTSSQAMDMSIGYNKFCKRRVYSLQIRINFSKK